MSDCNNCKHKDCWVYAEPCSSCAIITGEPTNWEPQTNADRIRAMSDEELAEYIWKLQNTKERRSTNGWLDWLKEEVDDE